MKVTVIGLGPGGGADLTGRARAALEACDLIVGYTAYIDLVRADFPQKETLSTGMRREVDRCRAASTAARQRSTSRRMPVDRVSFWGKSARTRSM